VIRPRAGDDGVAPWRATTSSMSAMAMDRVNCGGGVDCSRRQAHKFAKNCERHRNGKKVKRGKHHKRGSTSESRSHPGDRPGAWRRAVAGRPGKNWYVDLTVAATTGPILVRRTPIHESTPSSVSSTAAGVAPAAGASSIDRRPSGRVADVRATGSSTSAGSVRSDRSVLRPLRQRPDLVDYRDWTAAMRVPAVVGSWPERRAPTSGTPPISASAHPPPRPASSSANFAAPACQVVQDSIDPPRGRLGADGTTPTWGCSWQAGAVGPLPVGTKKPCWNC
jgi:hypothetical protein